MVHKESLAVNSNMFEISSFVVEFAVRFVVGVCAQIWMFSMLSKLFDL